MPCEFILKRGSNGVQFKLTDEKTYDPCYSKQKLNDAFKLIPLVAFSRGNKTTFENFCKIYHDQLYNIFIYATTYIQAMSKSYTIDQRLFFRSLCQYIYENSHASNKRHVTNYVLRK